MSARVDERRPLLERTDTIRSNSDLERNRNPNVATDHLDEHPWHGRHVYHDHYPDDYMGYRGFCSMPLGFWLFVFGWIFPILWFSGTFLIFSRNPFERRWAKVCSTMLLISFIVAVLCIIFDPTRIIQ